MDLPKIQIGCSDNSSVYLTTLEVPASDVNRNKTARASCVNRHAWSFDIEEVADSIAENRTSDPHSD
jgi:hypothetical protein